MARLRVLALDHYFDQDLRALEAHARLDVRRFPYQRLRGPALRIMGAAAADGLHGYNLPDLKTKRRRYAAWLAAEMRQLYLEKAFDVVVLPSDSFFYVRSLPAAVHALGLPVVVVQKETVISADTMEAHSRVMRDQAPFIADFMTVCSERHREFWLRAGGAPEVIEVTGQPRFDIYARPQPRRRSARTRVLFLSYFLDAYVPEADQQLNPRTWQPLREATEAVLLDAVRAGRCEVVVKCHPQQDQRAEKERLGRLAGTQCRRGLQVADPDADTRELIVDADIVVGFQTTALYEAVAAGRPVVFAAWGEAYGRLRGSLIAFHEAPDCVHHAGSPAKLAALLSHPPAAASDRCVPWYEEALGPVDGHATDRVAARLRAVVDAWPVTVDRGDLELRRWRYAVGLLMRSAAREAIWTAATPLARFAGQQRRVANRRRRAKEGRTMAANTLRGGRGPGRSLSRGGG